MVTHTGTYASSIDDGGLEFRGDRATLKVDRERLAVYSEDSRRGQPWRHTPEPEILVRSQGDGTASHLANWLDCLRSRKTPTAPLRAGVEAARAAHIANQSILAGARVRWNAADGPGREGVSVRTLPKAARSPSRCWPPRSASTACRGRDAPKGSAQRPLKDRLHPQGNHPRVLARDPRRGGRASGTSSRGACTWSSSGRARCARTTASSRSRWSSRSRARAWTGSSSPPSTRRRSCGRSRRRSGSGCRP
jgi:hypothetical protein